MKLKSNILTLLILSIFLFAAVSFAKERKVEEKTSKSETTQKAESKTSTSKSAEQKKEAPVKTETTAPVDNKVLTSEEILKKAGTPATTSTAAGEEINWQVISSGGNRGTSTNFILSGTIGQTAVGLGSSTNYMVNSGFWQNFAAATGCCVGIRGNINGDGGDLIDISDLVYYVAYSFQGGPAPPCFEEADVDASLTLDIGDIVYLVAYSFQGGPAPLPC